MFSALACRAGLRRVGGSELRRLQLVLRRERNSLGQDQARRVPARALSADRDDVSDGKVELPEMPARGVVIESQ